jgi:putative ABC transport system ATP-binding protein
MNIVECTDISKTYQQGKVDVRALRSVSLTIEKGEFIALAGPSGSGKTTLLNLIGGLDTIDSGTVRLDGEAVDEMSQSALAEMRLKKIGFVFQAYNLIPVLSALENVEYVMLLQGVPAKARHQRAKAALDEMGLSAHYHRRPAELSGGQQQRVAVARAVVSQPAIVLADEPTANLDSETGRGLLEMMQAMNETKKVTFVFSTHDQMVIDCARRRVLLKDGRVAEDQKTVPENRG